MVYAIHAIFSRMKEPLVPDFVLGDVPESVNLGMYVVTWFRLGYIMIPHVVIRVCLKDREMACFEVTITEEVETHKGFLVK